MKTGKYNALLLLALSSLISCSSESKVPPQKPAMAVPVRVGEAVRKTVPVQIRVIGAGEAYATVSVKAMVGGEITQVYIREGQDLKKGDLLFTIDPRPYEAALQQAEANLARDEAQVRQAQSNLAKDEAQVAAAQANLEKDMAQLKYAREEAQRYAFLAEKGYVARDQAEQTRTNYEALQATARADQAAIATARALVKADQAGVQNARAAVRASQAAVANARIQLGYCTIRSPVEGRAGSVLIQQGNVIKANDVTLLVIHRISPIYVTFSVPEQNLSEIKRYMAAKPLRVQALIPGEAEGEEGTLTFIDNTVDPATGTIRLKGTFANRQKHLWPGQFVHVILTLTEEPNALVIPSPALQTGQAGPYVYVVKPDLTVESRPVEVKRPLNGETVIAKGLEAGERVVTDGQLRLYPGAKVEVKGESPQGNKAS